MNVRELTDEEIEQKISHHLQQLSNVAVKRDTAQLQALNTKKVVRALNKHTDALVNAARASDKYASQLAWATWALVGATISLVIVALTQLLNQ